MLDMRVYFLLQKITASICDLIFLPAQTREDGRVMGEELRTLKEWCFPYGIKTLSHKGQNLVIAGLNTKASSLSPGFGSGVLPMIGNNVLKDKPIRQCCWNGLQM